ncbi:MAG TPA: ABC transporter ATP-binding protein [Stellaceae bacterium]|nr:ABC transporter ATP-binding protein [Stellaceae bacterium]
MSGGATQMPGEPLLDVSGLNVFLGRGASEVQVISDLSFAIWPGETVGMVGESGCGKTVTGLSLVALLPADASRITGRISLEGKDLTRLSRREMQRIRGRRIAMIFQEPMSALDPVFTIGRQITETIQAHFPVGAREARERAIEALAAVGIPLPARRYDEYPHQLSGGMRQRAMIAIALSCEPRLLIADEPTTALDVTVQSQIIDLLLEMTRRSGTALLFITHDLGVVAETCSRVLTIYAGELIEDAGIDDLLARPLHPYTSGLLRSIPRLSAPKSLLPSIPGRVPSLLNRPSGCRFAGRCAHAAPECAAPQVLQDEAGRRVRCCRHGELRLPGAVA